MTNKSGSKLPSPMTLHFLCHKLVFLISPAPDFSFHKLGYPLLSVSLLPGKAADHCHLRADSPHLRYRTTRPEPASLPSALSHAQGAGAWPSIFWPLAPLSNLCHGSHAVDAQPTVPDTTHSGRSLGLHCLCEVHFTSITLCLCSSECPHGRGCTAPARGQDDSAALCVTLAPFPLSCKFVTFKASSAS